MLVPHFAKVEDKRRPLHQVSERCLRLRDDLTHLCDVGSRQRFEPTLSFVWGLLLNRIDDLLVNELPPSPRRPDPTLRRNWPLVLIASEDPLLYRHRSFGDAPV